MPDKPPAPCTRPGCGALVHGGGPCDAHRAATRRAVDQARGSPQARGYGKAHRNRFRAGVLRRDVYCRCDLADHDHGAGPCLRPSTDADHWPIDRRTLVQLGLDPDDPARGRGLCHRCHSSATARNPAQGGHWRRYPS